MTLFFIHISFYHLKFMFCSLFYFSSTAIKRRLDFDRWIYHKFFSHLNFFWFRVVLFYFFLFVCLYLFVCLCAIDSFKFHVETRSILSQWRSKIVLFLFSFNLLYVYFGRSAVRCCCNFYFDAKFFFIVKALCCLKFIDVCCECVFVWKENCIEIKWNQ